MAIKIGMKTDLCMVYILMVVSITLLDLDARTQSLGRGTNSALNYLDN